MSSQEEPTSPPLEAQGEAPSVIVKPAPASHIVKVKIRPSPAKGYGQDFKGIDPKAKVEMSCTCCQAKITATLDPNSKGSFVCPECSGSVEFETTEAAV